MSRDSAHYASVLVFADELTVYKSAFDLSLQPCETFLGIRLSWASKVSCLKRGEKWVALWKRIGKHLRSIHTSKTDVYCLILEVGWDVSVSRFIN